MKDGRKMHLKRRPKWYGLHIHQNKEKNIELVKPQNNNKPSRKMEKDGFTKMFRKKNHHKYKNGSSSKFKKQSMHRVEQTPKEM